MEFTIANKQRRVPLDMEWLREVGRAALERCVHESGDGLFALKLSPFIEVAIVSDAVIANVHMEFMDVPGATDVITFDHGEIVASADTALRCAGEHGHSVEEELALYIVHGLLHLNGHDDLTPALRKKMHTAQDRIWKKLRKDVPRRAE